MATLTVNASANTGIDLTSVAVSAAGGGDQFANSGQEQFFIKNGDASPHTVTFATPLTVDGQAVADRTVTVPAGHSMLIGPFRPAYYNDTNGNVQVSYSAVTSVTVAVVKCASA